MGGRTNRLINWERQVGTQVCPSASLPYQSDLIFLTSYLSYILLPWMFPFRAYLVFFPRFVLFSFMFQSYWVLFGVYSYSCYLKTDVYKICTNQFIYNKMLKLHYTVKFSKWTRIPLFRGWIYRIKTYIIKKYRKPVLYKMFVDSRYITVTWS